LRGIRVAYLQLLGGKKRRPPVVKGKTVASVGKVVAPVVKGKAIAPLGKGRKNPETPVIGKRNRKKPARYGD